MESVYRRYFRVLPGKLLDRLVQMHKERIEAAKAISEFAEQVDAAVRIWTIGSGIAGFKFADQPDLLVWKKPDRKGLSMPRKNTPEGKEMLRRVEALPKFEHFEKALELVGLPTEGPCLFDPTESKAHRAIIEANTDDHIYFVSVPWRYVDQKELEDYKNDPDSGCIDYDHLLWQPTDELEEVAQSEVLRDVYGIHTYGATTSREESSV